MAYLAPTVAEQAAINLANLEGNINQTSPLNDKAFLRVLSIVEAVASGSAFKFAEYEIKQALVITAFGVGLDVLGLDYGIARKVAVSTVLSATLPGTDTTVINQTIDFIGDANGIRYFLDSSATIGTPTPGVADLSMTAETAGVVGNLLVGDTLSIGTQVAGAETVATVSAITTTGANEELDEPYRQRILDIQRPVFGGGNPADNRVWAQQVAGVTRAYPYSGKPLALLLDSFPLDRTVYVEADTTIDPDGLAPQSLLDSVRDSITTDPITGLARQSLGSTDETLYVESISRTSFFVQIRGLSVPSDLIATVKAELETAITAYFLQIKPFVDGVDSILDRNDKITDPTISNVVQDVLSANGGTTTGVAFGLSLGESLPEYQLTQGETAKLSEVNGITYV